MRIALFACASVVALAQSDPSAEFSTKIKPVLVENCGACHKAGRDRGHGAFTDASGVSEIDANRGLWRNVATQLRNRTMPPTASKLSEDDRFRISSWIDQRLKQTACDAGDYAGASVTRRLNRREYHNTIRELFGLDFEVAGLLPADGTGGAGFDTNGETLFIPPVLTEKYMEAAQQILDRVIVTPQLFRTVDAPQTLKVGEEAPVNLPIYLEGAYDVVVVVPGTGATPKLVLKVDGAEAGPLVPQKRRFPGINARAGGSVLGMQVNLARGSHVLAIAAEEAVTLNRILVQQTQNPLTPEKKALHHRLFGLEPGERPLDARRSAKQILESFLAKAFRRPVEPGEVDKFLVLYDRSAQRGDPYEERIKLALKAILVYPEFLFRFEQKHSQPGIHPLSQHELATRLSYFLWSSPPDEQLLRLADQGRLQDSKVLAAQVERMLDDNRLRAFLTSFIGQWLGTQDLGGRVAPLLTELQSYYTPEVAADLRAEPVLLLDRIVGENRSLLELVTADYTHMTQRMARFYEVEDKLKGLDDNEFRLVQWPDNRRAGVLGMGAVLALTSRYQETSPVLRGAWVLDTLLGTPVPPPPPDVPPLKTEVENGAKLTMRDRLMQHRANAACAACHKLMDPIGFGMENFDWMGRWRDKERDGGALDATGELPSGEKFNGPVELRQALLSRKEEFVSNIAGRVLGYALGRSLQDGDSCTVQKIVQALEKDNYRARTLIREIVLSMPFRNTQGGLSQPQPILSERRLDISKINALKQDNASHNIVGAKPQAAKPSPAKP